MYKEKVVQLVMVLVDRSLEDHYTKTHGERVKNVLASDAFPQFNEVDAVHSAKINGFVANLMQGIAREVYSALHDDVMKIIGTDVTKLVDELLTEEEAEEVHRFGTSPTGQKVFRNLDLLREGIQRGRNILAAEIIMAWSSNDVSKQIDGFIKSLDGEDDEVC